MKNTAKPLTILVSVLVFAVADAAADWSIEEPAKWIQMPDLTTNGIDVSFSEPTGMPYILADDFACTSSNHITDIHIFCSWYNDWDGGIASIRLSIWSDWPADAVRPYSTPSNELWSITLPFQDPRWTIRPIAAVPEGEWWWYPGQPLAEHPGDWTVYQLNTFLDPEEAFLQLGSPDQTNIYWLAVEIMPLDPMTQIGWKTRDLFEGHYMDDAVWSMDGGVSWEELRYPANHPFRGESIDFAFVLTSDMDFGDALDPSFPTLRSSNGARHQIVPGIFLGAAVDGEGDGIPSANADGDDLAGAVPDDEDGVVLLSPLVAGGSATVQVTASVPGILNGWIDFDNSGTWGDSPGEDLFPGGTNVMAGANILSFPVPPNAFLGSVYARFRFNTLVSLAPSGPAFDGEVEDYLFTIDEEERRDFGDAQDPTFPTMLPGGAWHAILPGLSLGTQIDAELDGQQSPNADGDDGNPPPGPDDEDGVQFVTPVMPGRVATVWVTSSQAAKLDAWIDFDGDGVWAHPGEHLFGGSTNVALGSNFLPFKVPASALPGVTYARFRLSIEGGLPPGGGWHNGEVEDHPVRIDRKGNPYEFFPGHCPFWLRRPDCNTGIDVESYRFAFAPSSAPSVADDWLGDGRPLTALCWWGSYIGWQSSSPDPVFPPGYMDRPGMFELTWWTDRPAGTYSNSMPKVVVATNIVALASYSVTNVPNGTVRERYYCTTDLTPLGQPGAYEHEYLYCLVLTNEFWQSLAKEGEIYWLGIRALYAGMAVPSYLWGWKTTHVDDNWQDNAVQWTNGTPGWAELRYPPPGWEHLAHPWSNRSVNTAFGLYTDVCGRRGAKWRQPPDMDAGENMPSWTTKIEGHPHPGEPMRADDFVSDGRRITDVHWWGSYIDWEWENRGPVEPPSQVQQKPLGFWLSWHTDIPTNVQQEYSMPGNPALKRFFVPLRKCHEVYYGAVEQWWKNPPRWEHEYQYYVDLLDPTIESGPWYETNDVVYWIDIQAVFPTGWQPEPGVHKGWGWKTTDPSNQWNDVSVVASNHAPLPVWKPGSFPTNHLPHGQPPPGKRMDLAFELTTDEPASNVWYGPIVITGMWAKVTNSPETCLIVSYGTSGAGTQYLESCDNLLVTNWIVVTNEPLPLPPPWTNKWRPDISLAASNRFWRVIER